MPKQQEFLDSTERFVALIGGYGSGKTLPVCIMGHLLSMSIPGNIGIILRRSLPKMHDSTERIYLEVLRRSGVGFTPREMRDGWPHRIIYPNGSEVYFRETKDLGRFLGPEYGWFYIDEAQEEPEKTFKDLVGRLRLPRASRYLRGILATNPPSNQHWIAKIWPKEGSARKTIKLPDGTEVSTTWRMIRSSTYDNPFLRSEYVAGLLTNHTPQEAKRIIEGYYGFVSEGDPVYPGFDFFRHVADPPLRRMALYRVWDFGFHCPACSWSQIFRCNKGGIHMIVHQEILGSEIETEAFYDTKILPMTNSLFPPTEYSHGLIVDGGDTAGAQVNEKGPGPIIRLSQPPPVGRNLTFRHQKFPDVDPGCDLIRRLLRTKCKCGYHLLIIHRRCQVTIEAMSGGYHFPKEKPGREKGRKPVKDGYYDNIMDTIRYCGELFYRPAEQGLEVVSEAQAVAEQTPGAWMGEW